MTRPATAQTPGQGNPKATVTTPPPWLYLVSSREYGPTVSATETPQKGRFTGAGSGPALYRQKCRSAPGFTAQHHGRGGHISAKHPPNEATQGRRDPLTKRGAQAQPPQLTASSRSLALPATSLPRPAVPCGLLCANRAPEPWDK